MKNLTPFQESWVELSASTDSKRSWRSASSQSPSSWASCPWWSSPFSCSRLKAFSSAPLYSSLTLVLYLPKSLLGRAKEISVTEEDKSSNGTEAEARTTTSMCTFTIRLRFRSLLVNNMIFHIRDTRRQVTTDRTSTLIRATMLALALVMAEAVVAVGADTNGREHYSKQRVTICDRSEANVAVRIGSQK